MVGYRMAIPRRRSIENEMRRRERAMQRSIGDQLLRIRLDAGASRARVADVAGVDRSYLKRIEDGTARPSTATLLALTTALGADMRVSFYPGSGPKLTDRHQSRMVECLLRRLDRAWTPHVEVPVSRPVRGVIDTVLERRAEGLFVAGEVQSVITRLEQTIRWSAEKAAALGSSSLARPGSEPRTSRLLVVRSTGSTRDLARTFESTLRTAYPARTDDAVVSLVDGAPWPGDAVIWVRIEGDRVEILDGPPRGVRLGR